MDLSTDEQALLDKFGILKRIQVHSNNEAGTSMITITCNI